MAMSVVAFGLFQLFHYAFLTTLFTHDLWFGLAFSLVVIHVILWTADHAHDTPEMLFPLQVYWSLCYPLGWLAAVAFVHLFGTPKLIDVAATGGNGVSGRRPSFRRSVAVAMFVFGWIAAFASINFFMKRFSTAGMSPFDPSVTDHASNLAGVATLVLAAILVVASTAMLAGSKDPMSWVSIKYLWILGSVIWTGFIHDYLTDVTYAGAVAWPPGGAMLAAFAVVMLVVGPILALFIPVNTDLDPFYRRRRRTWRFFGSAFAAVAGALIVAWVLNVVTNGNEVTIFAALAAYTVVLSLVLLLVARSLAGPSGKSYVLLSTRAYGRSSSKRLRAE